MKILLTNKTQYRDEDLRAFVHGACEAAGVRLRVLRLSVTTSRCGTVTGYAYYPTATKRSEQHTNAMRLRIPPPHEVSERKVAQVAVHEAMHLNGASHGDMTEEQYNCAMPVPWADALELRVKDAKPKPQPIDPELRKAAARSGRLEHAQAMLAKAQTRLKRATTIEKKWKRRVGALSR